MPPPPASAPLASLETIARRYPVIDAASLDTCVQLLHTSAAVNDAFDAQYARHGIARGRFRVLVLLYRAEAGGLSPAELAGQAGVTRAAMTGLVDALVEAGLAAREDDAFDRRTYRVRLTDRGHAFLHGMLPDHFRRMAAMMAGLSASEQKALRKLLAKVASKLHLVADDRPRLSERKPGAGSEKAAPDKDGR